MRQRPIREVEWTRARDIRRELESDTKDGLVHAAREVFAVKGYDSATIGDITAAASVSRPTFYVYFASKSEIFRVIAARLRDELLEAHHHPQQVAEDPVLVSRASMEAFIRLYADNLEILDEIEKRAQTMRRSPRSSTLCAANPTGGPCATSTACAKPDSQDPWSTRNMPRISCAR